ncbi:pregnancy zone protein-like [Larimichthys crocea]|uniref:pregnancy zone protein-like n=1 Tax=Larimichthys crocea TaxID=215358 RepID=UPI000F5E8C3F|nr:pregnancy zone protein-like [Larimichthys crocea]
MQSVYSGKETSTNMVILDIKMLSGFVPDPESLKRLKGALLVDRVEQKEDHVLVYLQELPKDIPINHSIELIQELPVQNLKPAVVKIYDYYQTSDQAETEYIYPCSAGSPEVGSSSGDVLHLGPVKRIYLHASCSLGLTPFTPSEEEATARLCSTVFFLVFRTHSHTCIYAHLHY